MMSPEQYEAFVASKNTAWRKASKQRRRVWLAKDVIAQLNERYFGAKPQRYINSAYYSNATRCEGCALGSLVVACKLRNKDTNLFNDVNRESVVDKLRELFSRDQLKDIELAFEARGNVGIDNEFTESNMQAKKWAEDYRPETRLRLIMGNIINNKGAFVLGTGPTDKDFKTGGVTSGAD